MLDLNMIKESYDRIKDYIYKTPLERSIFLSDDNTNYYLKLECLQPPKSFKFRGALSKMTTLDEEQKKRGVVAVSSGNHGAAVSMAAKLLGIENVLVFVPKVTPESKIQKIRYYGGTVNVIGENYDEAHRIGMEYINNHDMVFVDPYYSDPLVYAGQGTSALEMFDQNPNLDTIIVPIGGGGLITGISIAAKAINPDVKIIGVQTESCPAMFKSIEDETFYEEYPIDESICEALVGGVGKLSYDMANDCIDDILIVKEDYIKRAVAHMINKEKVVAEPSSAICVGAVMQYPDYFTGKEIAMLISGGNIDESLMLDILNEEK